MKRAALALTFALAPAAFVGCALIDGLRGSGVSSEGELCDAAQTQMQSSRDCFGGGGGAGGGPNTEDVCGGDPARGGINTACLFEHRDDNGDCRERFDAFSRCLLDEHSCDELVCCSGTGDGALFFCQSELDDYRSFCPGVAGCSGGGGIDSGCVDDGRCTCGANGTAFEGPDCVDCAALPSCTDGALVCEPALGEDNFTCPCDCQDGGVELDCVQDGFCDFPSETVANCDSDCFCNGNDECDAWEPDDPGCNDCSIVGTCDDNGVCEGSESAADCGDCAPCVDNTVCEPFENVSACADCSSLEGGGCFFGDQTCMPGENVLCSDCSQPCSFDGDCASSRCENLNERLCNEGQQNCSTALPRTSICVDPCTDETACGTGRTCVEAAPGRRHCEVSRCADGNDCALGTCVSVGDMSPVFSGTVGGFCLPFCDPLDCYFGGNCACAEEDPFFRCAPYGPVGEAADGFVCTTAGASLSGEPCGSELDCVVGAACFDALCRSYCDTAGGSCAGTCEPLGATGVSVCVLP